MSTITIAAIETDIGTVFHKVGAVAISIEHGAEAVLPELANIAGVVAKILAMVPGLQGPAAAAEATVVLINAFDTAVVATDNATKNGITWQVPAAIVQQYVNAKKAVLTYENTI